MPLSGLSRHQMPSLSSMHCFEAAARLGSFALAAQELDMTQSAVSKRIAQLEETLQIRLFSRERKTLVLTPAGGRFLKDCMQIINQTEAATLDILRSEQLSDSLLGALCSGESDGEPAI